MSVAEDDAGQLYVLEVVCDGMKGSRARWDDCLGGFVVLGQDGIPGGNSLKEGRGPYRVLL